MVKRKLLMPVILILFSLSLTAQLRPDPLVLNRALQGLEYFTAQREVPKKIVIVDFSRPSTEPRLFVWDVAGDSALMHSYVAHGVNSGSLYASSFSNIENSHQSSLGFYRISEQYTGKHGLSIRLDGLEEGFNDNARKRAIVIHGAWYVSDEMVREQGRLGRSFGCPALSAEDFDRFKDLVDFGTLLFIYYPDDQYFAHSQAFASDQIN